MNHLIESSRASHLGQLKLLKLTGIYSFASGKENTSDNTYIDLFNEMISKYPNNVKIYTDGSSNPLNKGCAITNQITVCNL